MATQGIARARSFGLLRAAMRAVRPHRPDWLHAVDAYFAAAQDRLEALERQAPPRGDRFSALYRDVLTGERGRLAELSYRVAVALPPPQRTRWTTLSEMFGTLRHGDRALLGGTRGGRAGLQRLE